MEATYDGLPKPLYGFCVVRFPSVTLNIGLLGNGVCVVGFPSVTLNIGLDSVDVMKNKVMERPGEMKLMLWRRAGSKLRVMPRNNRGSMSWSYRWWH